MIQKVNGIVNYNYLLPGTMLWLPSPTPSATEPYYTLLAHTLIAGETPAALCRSYGIDYASSYNMLSALNNNMTTFMAGQEFILPEYVIPGGQGGAGHGAGDGNPAVAPAEILPGPAGDPHRRDRDGHLRADGRGLRHL